MYEQNIAISHYNEL